VEIVSLMMGPGAGGGTCLNHEPYARVRKTGFRSRGVREGADLDRVLADLALGLRGLDLPSFTREVVRCAREGLGVEHCEVSRFLTEGSRESDFGSTARSRENGLFGGISVVVCANDRAFGILSAYSASRRCYMEEEAGFLQDLAGLLGTAVERALSAEAQRRSLEKERRRAEAAEEKYAFLHEANADLTAAPDADAALATARRAVPALADSCFVDLMEGGASRGWIRRVVVARSGRAGDRPDRELALWYPLDTNAPQGTPKVLRPGQPELIPDVPDGLLRSLACGREHLELMRNLAPGSYLCVPLQVGLHLIGSIGFVSSRSGRGGRRHGPEGLGRTLTRRSCASGRPPERSRRDEGGAAREASGETHLWDAVLDTGPVLTPRQFEVLRLLDGGMSVHQIKVELGLSEPTVRTHVRAILRAFDACSQLEALHKARIFGFVDGMTRNAAADRSP